MGVGGNIGTPALDLLGRNHDLYVLELSSFQLESLFSLKPLGAVVLNISEDHMDRYQGLDDYAAAKQRIYQGASVAVVNLDDEHVQMSIRQMPVASSALYFTLDEPQQQNCYGVRLIEARRWLCRGDEQLCPVDALRLVGDHNIANALAALALAEAADLPFHDSLNALLSFSGLPHRSQLVAEIDGVQYFNDSKATNVGASRAALMGLHRDDETRSIAILGGDCKDADFSEMREVTATTCRAVVLLGRDAGEIEKHIPDSVETLHAASLEQAVALAAEKALPGDRVLLSPACASFDMFKSFEDRGQQFVRIVQEMQQ